MIGPRPRRPFIVVARRGSRSDSCGSRLAKWIGARKAQSFSSFFSLPTSFFFFFFWASRLSRSTYRFRPMARCSHFFCRLLLCIYGERAFSLSIAVDRIDLSSKRAAHRCHPSLYMFVYRPFSSSPSFTALFSLATYVYDIVFVVDDYTFSSCDPYYNRSFAVLS